MRGKALCCIYELPSELLNLFISSKLLITCTVRYLHKMFNQQLSQSQLPPNIVYLASDFPKHTSCAAHSPEQFSDPNLLLRAYLQRARTMVDIAVAQYQLGKTSGLDDVAAWNGSSVDWTNAAKVSSCTGQHCHYGLFTPQAHCHFVVLRVSMEAVQNADVCPANLAILNALCSLYAMFGIVQSRVQHCIRNVKCVHQRNCLTSDGTHSSSQ